MHRAWMRQSDLWRTNWDTMNPELAAEADPDHHRCQRCCEAWKAFKEAEERHLWEAYRAAWQAEIRDTLRSGKAWTCELCGGRSIPARPTSERPSTWEETTLAAIPYAPPAGRLNRNRDNQ